MGVCIVQGPSQRRNACGLVALPRLPVCALSTVTVLTRHRHTAFVPHRHRPSVQAQPSPSSVLSPPLAAHASLPHPARLRSAHLRLQRLVHPGMELDRHPAPLHRKVSRRLSWHALECTACPPPARCSRRCMARSLSITAVRQRAKAQAGPAWLCARVCASFEGRVSHDRVTPAAPPRRLSHCYFGLTRYRNRGKTGVGYEPSPVPRHARPSRCDGAARWPLPAVRPLALAGSRRPSYSVHTTSIPKMKIVRG